MNTYQIWFRTVGDDRAPEVVDLVDYKWVGEFEASSPKALMRKIRGLDAKDSGMLEHRPPKTGDVLIDYNENALILTPSGIWAQVEVIDTKNEKVVDR